MCGTYTRLPVSRLTIFVPPTNHPGRLAFAVGLLLPTTCRMCLGPPSMLPTWHGAPPRPTPSPKTTAIAFNILVYARIVGVIRRYCITCSVATRIRTKETWGASSEGAANYRRGNMLYFFIQYLYFYPLKLLRRWWSSCLVHASPRKMLIRRSAASVCLRNSGIT